jgi:hypothetical protein
VYISVVLSDISVVRSQRKEFIEKNGRIIREQGRN